MKIIVAIKQVPYVDQLRFDKELKRLVREGVESEINPFDKRALTWAINYKHQSPETEVVVLTMGPPQASSALIEALAMGADRAVHLLGREFAGADTLATARALADACRKIGYDLILCGKYSTDAETAQVPPMLAELLDLPQVTGATELSFSAQDKHIVARRELDNGFETVECALPAVVSAAERLAKPIKVAPADLEAGKAKPIEIMTAGDLTGSPGGYGLSGSPTWVSEIYSIELARKHVIRDANIGIEAVVAEVVRDLTGQGLFGEGQSKARKKTVQTSMASSTRLPDEKGSFWVAAELAHGQVRPVTFELLGRSIDLAGKLGIGVGAVLVGYGVREQVEALAAYGADTVYVADAPPLTDYLTEPYTAVLVEAIRKYQPYAVLFPSTANGRDWAPRIAARLQVGLTGDCIGLEVDDQGRLVQLKPAFGGNIVAPILAKTKPALATVRPGMLEIPVPDWERRPALVTLPTDHLPPPRAQILGIEPAGEQAIELDDARIVVGVGMGIGGSENLAAVRNLAMVLGAPVTGTRRVVDAGWLPRQLQVGLTGRSVAPDLYVALGISGKFNHLVGIRRAGTILAVNSNPDAEIFAQADYGIVGDWARVVPTLTRALEEAKSKSHR